ncbi:hypothetical protein [Brevibacillus brevis]|uniref:Uncharacterized protein n=1 Tax=Brevibacillus brevis TaxID=1393 RepID=A0ABY9TAU8_BREBE|nr:hypothetical protein [Brevibacillus brevis]WNC17043.1 hypothetical protein RGB73_12270 [Brevibacillus brevis]
MTIILAILGIGLVLFIIAAVVIVALLKSGAKWLWKMGGHRHRHYSSSDYKRQGPFMIGGHKSYGHRHYGRKRSSRSFFFSS